jgi:phage minor structural protein
VFVYAPNATDFDTLGLCGPLTPTKCEFDEKRNGLSQLILDHPIDDYERWKLLVPGCVFKAEVPVRTTPEIDGTTLITTTETWKVKTDATSGDRKMYSKPSGGRALKTLPIWADKAKTKRFEVTVVRKGTDRYKAKTKYGSGWISKNALEYSVTSNIPNDPAAIETVESAWTTKPQLFRIREAVVSETGVSVTASHIFYDLAGNITTWSGYDSAAGTNYPTCAAALEGILAGCAAAHEFEGYTNMLDQRAGVTWTRTAAVEALLAADTGLVDRWGAELVRDNYEFYVLREAGQNRGVRIEYGKNLLGVECTTDVTDVIARIMPVGKTYKDKDLFLAPGTFTVNGTTVTIATGETWVTSSQASDYPAPMMSVLDTDIKAKSKSSSDVLAARLKMIEAALNKFTDEKCDQPSVNVKVTFVNLGDTVEYEQYKRLEDVFLCDRVTVRHPGIGVDVLTEVIEVVWDCLTGRAKSIELGRVQLDRARIKVPVWQLPGGIPGTLVASGTLSAGAAKDDFGASLDLSANTTAIAMYVVVESSAGSVLKGQATTVGATLTARVYRGGVEITGDLDASLFAWSRESGNATSDATWAAAHAGVKTVAVTAAEFASASAIYHCDVADAAEEA